MMILDDDDDDGDGDDNHILNKSRSSSSSSGAGSASWSSNGLAGFVDWFPSVGLSKLRSCCEEGLVVVSPWRGREGGGVCPWGGGGALVWGRGGAAKGQLVYLGV